MVWFARCPHLLRASISLPQRYQKIKELLLSDPMSARVWFVLLKSVVLGFCLSIGGYTFLLLLFLLREVEVSFFRFVGIVFWPVSGDSSGLIRVYFWVLRIWLKRLCLWVYGLAKRLVLDM